MHAGQTVPCAPTAIKMGIVSSALQAGAIRRTPIDQATAAFARGWSCKFPRCAAAARQGFGLVQAPRYRFIDDLANGRLIEVLTDFPPTPTPLSVIYPNNKQLSPRVRVFVDWLVEIIGSKLPGL